MFKVAEIDVADHVDVMDAHVHQIIVPSVLEIEDTPEVALCTPDLGVGLVVQ